MSCPLCKKTGAVNSTAISEEEKKNGIRIALAGNPNCGKTTTFNAYTGAHQHVGNYPGVTVEKRKAGRTAEARRFFSSIFPARILSLPIPWKNALCAMFYPRKTIPNAPAPL